MNMNTDAVDSADEEERAGRLPSLAAQTPAIDIEQAARTLQDAAAYFALSDPWGSRHILVPLDGSDLAKATLPIAARIAAAL